MSLLTVKLITPEKIAFEAEAESVSLPTTTGEITILPGHVSLVSQLSSGEFVVRTKAGEQVFAVTGGFVEVTPQLVRILAEAADHADDLDVAKVEEARLRAEKFKEEAQGEMEIAEASAALAHALAQLKVAHRKQRHH